MRKRPAPAQEYDSGTHIDAAYALACFCSGFGGEALRTYNDQIQDDVLWLLRREIELAKKRLEEEDFERDEKQRRDGNRTDVAACSCGAKSGEPA